MMKIIHYESEIDPLATAFFDVHMEKKLKD